MDQQAVPASSLYPKDITMPVGSGPESIVIAEGPYAYVSSLKTGAVYWVDLKHGTSEVFLPPVGSTAVGMALDQFGQLYVCGGMDGILTLIDTANRSVIARYDLAVHAARVLSDHNRTFLNELILTPEAAWITDSFAPVIYKFPFGDRGALPAAEDIVAIPLTGDLVYEFGQEFSDNFNSNGIAPTPDGKAILVVQTNTGKLFRVDKATGHTTQVDLGGDTVDRGDGLVLERQTLYVVQNLANTVSVIDLDSSGGTGKVVERRTDPRFDTPTAMARFGNRFYLSNARFTTPSPQAAEFSIISIPA
jgi:DNA-binding beta-propeller fold protein YncE